MRKQASKIVALVLLLLLGAFGFTVVARADGITIAICMTLDDFPTISGVNGVLNGMMKAGFTARQAGFKIGEAVNDVCPEHKELVLRYAQALDDAPMRIS